MILCQLYKELTSWIDVFQGNSLQIVNDGFLGLFRERLCGGWHLFIMVWLSAHFAHFYMHTDMKMCSSKHFYVNLSDAIMLSCFFLSWNRCIFCSRMGVEIIVSGWLCVCVCVSTAHARTIRTAWHSRFSQFFPLFYYTMNYLLKCAALDVALSLSYAI